MAWIHKKWKNQLKCTANAACIRTVVVRVDVEFVTKQITFLFLVLLDKCFDEGQTEQLN